MMRWIVAASLKFRFVVVLAAVAMMVYGVTELRRDARVDVFPEFAPLRVEIQTPTLGLSAAEVEEFVTVPLEHQLNGVPGLDVIRSSSVPQLSSITLIFERGTDLLDCPPARAGAAGDDRSLSSELGGAAGDDAAPLVDQPGDEDRALVGRALLDRAVVHLAAHDPTASAARARRGQRRHLGPAERAAARARRRRADARARRLGEPRHGGDLERPRRASARSLAGRARRDRGVRRHSEPADRGRPRPAGRRARGPRGSQPREPRRADDPAKRRRRHRHGASAADRRRGHQRRRRSPADRREVPRRQHARGDPRAWRRRSTRSGRAWTASRSTPRSSGRRPSSRWRSTTSHGRC